MGIGSSGTVVAADTQTALSHSGCRKMAQTMRCESKQAITLAPTFTFQNGGADIHSKPGFTRPTRIHRAGELTGPLKYWLLILPASPGTHNTRTPPIDNTESCGADQPYPLPWPCVWLWSAVSGWVLHPKREFALLVSAGHYSTSS